MAMVAAAIALYPFVYFGQYLGDAEIHLVYGANAAQGRYFEFNPGEKSSGITSVGYMLLLAQLFKAVPAEYVPLALKIIDIIGWYAVAGLTFLMGRRLVSETWAIAAAVVVGMMPGSVYNATQGMENGLFALAVAVAFYLMMKLKWLAPHEPLSRPSDIAVAAMMGICCALRPEGMALAAMAIAYRAYVNWTAAHHMTTVLSKVVIPAAVVFAMTLPLALFHHSQTGDWLPGSALSRVTIAATGAISIGPLWLDPRFAARLVPYAPITLLFLVGNVLILRGRWRSEHRVAGLMVLVFWVFFILYSTVLGAVHLARYVMFLMPLMVLVAAIGGERLWAEWERTRWTSRLPSRAVVFAGLALLLAAVFTVETFLRLPLGGSDELWRVMRAPRERQAYSDGLMAALGNPTGRPVSIAYQEVQFRYWLDDRFVIRSLDGRTDGVLLKHVHNGNYDHIAYLRERQVDYLAELVNYNRDRNAWSLLELGHQKLQPGESITHGEMTFVLLANGMFAVLDATRAP